MTFSCKLNLIALVILTFISLNGCIRVNISPLSHEAEPASEEIILPAENWSTDEKVALIDIEGTIGMGKCKPLSLCASGILNVLDRVKADPKVKALILNISSNGGEITVTDIIYQAIMQLKAEKGIPVYAFVQRGAYSGGYYIALAADEITALPTSFVGSI